MENLYSICSKTNIKAQELYRIIASDNELSREVLRMAHRISSNLQSLANAFIILGINTIRNIVLNITNSGLVSQEV
jgi:HD-like signal output (HDOD) protein